MIFFRIPFHKNTLTFLLLRNRLLGAWPWLYNSTLLKKTFTENIEAIWTRSFTIRAKIEMQEQFSLRLTLQPDEV